MGNALQGEAPQEPVGQVPGQGWHGLDTWGRPMAFHRPGSPRTIDLSKLCEPRSHLWAQHCNAIWAKCPSWIWCNQNPWSSHMPWLSSMAQFWCTLGLAAWQCKPKNSSMGWHMWSGTHVWSTLVLRMILSTMCWTTWTWNWHLRMLWSTWC